MTAAPAVAAIVVALGAGSFPAQARSATCGGRADGTDARAVVLCLHTRERARAGLPRLRPNPSLRRAAQRHADHMVAAGFFDHTAPDGTGTGDRVQRSGYLRGAEAFAFGENLAFGTGHSAAPRPIVRQWMRSPGHRDNVLDPRFRDIGIGVAAGGPDGAAGRTYTVVFGVRG